MKAEIKNTQVTQEKTVLPPMKVASPWDVLVDVARRDLAQGSSVMWDDCACGRTALILNGGYLRDIVDAKKLFGVSRATITTITLAYISGYIYLTPLVIGRMLSERKGSLDYVQLVKHVHNHNGMALRSHLRHRSGAVCSARSGQQRLAQIPQGQAVGGA